MPFSFYPVILAVLMNYSFHIHSLTSDMFVSFPFPHYLIQTTDQEQYSSEGKFDCPHHHQMLAYKAANTFHLHLHSFNNVISV